MPLRLIFMGTPEFAVPTLLALADHGHEIVAVYTREPKPAKRCMKLQPTPVEQAARQLGIPVLTPKTLRTPEAEAEFRSHNADAAVVGSALVSLIADASGSAQLVDRVEAYVRSLLSACQPGGTSVERSKVQSSKV